MKKVLAFCIVALALILTGCKEKNAPAFNGFTINQGSQMTMVQGASERLSMKIDGQNCTPVYTFESSDPSMVDVDSTGVVYAMAITESPVTITVTGTAVINNEKIVKTATIAISVIEFADGLVFNEFYLMQAQEDWEEGRYPIYQIRRNRASEVSDGDDATVRTERIEGNRNKVDSVFPAYNQWVHLYDTVNSQGQTVQMGLFMDSVTRYRAWILSTDCFFDSEGAFQCASQGAVMSTFFAFVQDSKYAYVLGEREFVEDVTALDTIRPQGVDAMPMPGYFQTGHFDEDQYLDFWTRYMDEEEVSISDYNFWAMYDSKFQPVSVGYDQESGESYTYTLPVMGYPMPGGWINFESGAGEAWLDAAAYDFEATMYDNPLVGYCLKLETKTGTDPETGEEIEYLGYAEPLQMADSHVKTYQKGSVSSAPKASEARPISNKSLNVKMKVASTLGATFRMAVLNK